MAKPIPQHIKDNGALCYWCKVQEDKKVPALWRSDTGFIDMNNITCTMHAHLIVEESEDNDHRTEADEQTWMRL